MQEWYKGIVTVVINETKNVKRFVIKVTGQHNFQFKPGQHISIDQGAVEGQLYNSWKSYSIASAPGSDSFELVISRPAAGTGEWFWENITTGAELDFHGPQGKFLLPDTIDRDIYMICTGTGIAPFRSMLQHIHKNNIPHRNIYLVTGYRRFQDALFFSEMKTLEQQVEAFYYLPTFSREAANNHLLMRTGYVHGIYEEFMRRNMILNGVNGVPTLKPAHFYICGWHEMIGDAKERILMYGYTSKDIELEVYG